MRSHLQNVTIILVALFALGAAPAFAATIINVEVNPSVSYQQTINNPCVIGDSSCKQPAGMDYTKYPGTPGGNGDTYDSYSPTYTYSQLVGFLGGETSFVVGIDENFATGAGNEVLQEFQVWYCPTGTCTSYTANQLDNLAVKLGNKDTVLTAAGYSLLYTTDKSYIMDTHNGNGYSDALTDLMSISGLTSAQFVFEGKVSNDTDGMEEFFLIRKNAPPAVPEPTTLLLLGTGLFGTATAAARRRKANKNK